MLICKYLKNKTVFCKFNEKLRQVCYLKIVWSPAVMFWNPLCEQFAVLTVHVHRRGSHNPSPDIRGRFRTNRGKIMASKQVYNTCAAFLDVIFLSQFLTSFWKIFDLMAGGFAFVRHWDLSQLCVLLYFDSSMFPPIFLYLIFLLIGLI